MEMDRKRGVDHSLLRPIQRFTTSSNFKIELFNAQSLTNKSGFIHDHIRDKSLDIMCLTETWQKPGVFSVLNETCPPSYCYLQKARSSGRGGGLAVIYRSHLDLSLLDIPELSSFECLAFNCKPPFPMTVLLIYRPPKSTSNFISELYNFLSTICATSSNIIILGDFNIHVNNPTCHLATEFLQLLDCLNLRQYVDVPTHIKGNILDLVITESALLSAPFVYDLGVSDHKVISMELSFPSSYMKPKREIRFRNLKKINTENMTLSLQHLLSSNISSVTESVEFYNQTLSRILDFHAPVKVRTITFSRSAPWFTSDLRKMKAAGRALERRYNSSELTVHKLAYRDHQKAYLKSIKEARSQYYSNIIQNSPGNSKKLFATINHLLKPQSAPLTGATEEKCNDFMTFFRTKIAKIRSSFSVSSPSSFPTADQQSGSRLLCCFPEVTQPEVEDIIKGMRSSTCALDPFPTALVKANISVISPFITMIINQSIQSGHVPFVLKTAIIRPLLKKPTLDPQTLANYRPISNLPFLSKVLEKVVARHLHDHLKYNNLFEKFQSSFRSAHSTETALVRVTNDLLMTADAGSPSLLVLLDLSAAFDTVDHGILLKRLHHSIGLNNTVLRWFESYLTDRSEFVAMGSSRSRLHAVDCGVPQGSVLGPILFILYMLPLGKVISRLGISFHCYADDTQLYIKTDTHSSTSSTILSTVTACLEEIRAWMTHNFLQLNSSKTEAILIGSPHQIRSSSITCITFSGQDIPLSSLVTNLGVKFDPHLTFEAHIKHLCKTSYLHLRNIARLRPTLTLHDAEKLIHAFVSSRLDYCNALLIGIPSKSIQKLQHIQNSAAGILMRVRKYEHITPILRSLHWLPISARIEYKVSLLTHQCIHGNAPSYLQELLTPQTSARSLRSTNTHRLRPPKTKSRTIGDRAFCAAAPRLWNALPEHLRAPQTTNGFKKDLKTYLFKKFFNV
uniref:Reverse transcriptase domain-containing protein n=2 Tax=Cyprinus carpio TaxID=7962 RepID=A0A8C1W0H1_CYPCA